ncbi:MAG: FAD-dependent oxidoreductase, partial [Ramlibacter sp.]|nr:FAD-dependent oxidoreductase [Ramlibacter sp.]
MIRLSEIKLPLAQADSPLAALHAASAQVLGVAPAAIASVHVFKRSFDARKADLAAVYIVDVMLADAAQEAVLLAKFEKHPHIGPTPDMHWHAPVQAPPDLPLRPVVVGFGPCGIFAALA